MWTSVVPGDRDCAFIAPYLPRSEGASHADQLLITPAFYGFAPGEYTSPIVGEAIVRERVEKYLLIVPIHRIDEIQHFLTQQSHRIELAGKEVESIRRLSRFG